MPYLLVPIAFLTQWEQTGGDQTPSDPADQQHQANHVQRE